MMVLPTLADKNNLIFTDARKPKILLGAHHKKTFESYCTTRKLLHNSKIALRDRRQHKYQDSVLVHSQDVF